MPGVIWTYDPNQSYRYGEQPTLAFRSQTAMTGFAANGSLSSGTGTAEFSIATSVVENAIWRNDNDYETTFWWSAEYAGKTDKDTNGYLTDWLRLDDATSGSTQTVSYRKAKWESNQQNGLPHLEFGNGDYLILDDAISMRSNSPWTIAFVTGPNTPGLFGCYLGSHNATGSAIESAYRWAGRTMKLRNDDGEEVTEAYTSTEESEYGGGGSSLHILQCDGSDQVYMRWNGDALDDYAVSTGSQFTFSRIGHLQTTSTQQNSAFSLCELVVLDGYLTGSDLSDLEGQLCSKWGITDKLPSSHAHYNATATNGYNTPKITSSNDATNGSLTLSTTETAFTMKSSTLSANTPYYIYPIDVGTPGTITLKVTWS